MPNPSSKLLFREFVDGIGNVVLQAGKIGEAQVQLLDVVVLGVIQDFLRIHLSSKRGSGVMWECLNLRR